MPSGPVAESFFASDEAHHVREVDGPFYAWSNALTALLQPFRDAQGTLTTSAAVRPWPQCAASRAALSSKLMGSRPPTPKMPASEMR
eukprot:7796022-Pyramimonas_sp.AAC.1